MEAGRRQRARATGAATFAAARRLLAHKAAALIRSDPADAAVAVEMGLIDRRWLEHPDEHPVSTAAPVEIVERFLERTVERRPSRLSALGLSAVQLLAWRDPSGTGDPVASTIVFTDLEGFTAYTDSQGDDAALALVTEHHLHAGPVVRRWGGRIVKTLGDGLLCSFSEAEAGIRAAVDLLDTAPAPLRLRAGVHSGEALASRGDLYGHAVNVAARVTDTAQGGEVVATADAVAAAGTVRDIRFGPPKRVHLKGVENQITVCRVLAAGPAGPASPVLDTSSRRPRR